MYYFNKSSISIIFFWEAFPISSGPYLGVLARVFLGDILSVLESMCNKVRRVIVYVNNYFNIFVEQLDA